MEQMIPNTVGPVTVVPGLVTVKAKGKNGATQNVFAIDALELIRSGEYELVENGSVEAARLNANPLRSAYAGTNLDVVVAEVTGIAGGVVVATGADSADELRAAADQADAVTAQAEANAKAAAEKLEADKAAAAKKQAEDAATEEAAKKLAETAAAKAKANATK